MNRVKFALIHEFEQHLPAAPYKYEWLLAGGGQGKAYRAVTTIERWIPGLFAVLHVVLALIIGFELASGFIGLSDKNTLTEWSLR